MDEPAGASDVALDDPWSAVPGQPAAVARLQAAVANPVHTYLFVGPEGTGKRAALRTFGGRTVRRGGSGTRRTAPPVDGGRGPP